jgi:hypothetical protein
MAALALGRLKASMMLEAFCMALNVVVTSSSDSTLPRFEPSRVTRKPPSVGKLNMLEPVALKSADLFADELTLLTAGL